MPKTMTLRAFVQTQYRSTALMDRRTDMLQQISRCACIAFWRATKCNSFNVRCQR